MKTRGFTLIELLAVIVILAIIALIAVPIIMNIISQSKESANKRSIELYGKAVEQAIATYQINNPNNEIEGTYFSGTTRGTLSTWRGGMIDIEVSIEGLTIDYEGTEVKCKLVRVYEDGKIYMDLCSIGNHDVDYTYGTYKQVYKPNYYWFNYSSGNVNNELPRGSNQDLSVANPNGHLVYLGFDTDELNNIISAYVCFKKNDKEYCQKGYDTDVYKINENIIKEAYADFAVPHDLFCSFDDYHSSCSVGVAAVAAYSNGGVFATGRNIGCRIGENGDYECTEI